jgi:hypothetical protein
VGWVVGDPREVSEDARRGTRKEGGERKGIKRKADAGKKAFVRVYMRMARGKIIVGCKISFLR